MSDVVNVWDDEKVRAAYWAMHTLPTPPGVVAASKAGADLVRRRVEADWPDLSRDERRLEARYERVIAAHDQLVLDAYRAAKAAPPPTNGAP